MAFRAEFESSGNWLFRWRSFLPVVLIAFYLLALRESRHLGQNETFDAVWAGVCIAVGFIGLAIRMLTIGRTPRGTSGRNTREQIAESLNTTGMYSMVRNPLYLGNFFMGLGIALFAQLWWVVVIYTLIFWLYYERIIFAEEEFLRKKFGDEFTEWAKVTPVFVPRLRRYRKSEVPFSLRTVLRQEYSAFFAFIVVLFILNTAGELYVEGRLEFDLWWLVLLGAGFVIWMVLRSLKKYTTVLNVEGRC